MFYDKESVAINLAVIKIKLLLKKVLYVSQVKYNYMNINVLFKQKLDIFFYYTQFKLMFDNEIFKYIDKLKNCYKLYDI